MFRGIYHGKRVHCDDFVSMLKRCSSVNLTAIMSTSTSMEDFKENTAIIKEFSNEEGIKISTTLGVHPSYCESVFKGKECKSNWGLVDEYFERMLKVFQAAPEHLVALGECGLDYARLFRSGKECQLEFFQRHFDLLGRLEAEKRPPMFLHMRDCKEDFLAILKKNSHVFPGGVVHSFTGSVEDVEDLLAFSPNLFIGFNGCSLREELGIQVALKVPLDRIMIESDAPYCEMRPSHASAKFLSDFEEWPILRALDKSRHSLDHPVRGRNEPSETRRVLRVLSKLRNIDENELAEIIYANTLKLFPNCRS